jgi:hypothetical protein
LERKIRGKRGLGRGIFFWGSSDIFNLGEVEKFGEGEGEGRKQFGLHQFFSHFA